MSTKKKTKTKAKATVKKQKPKAAKKPAPPTEISEKHVTELRPEKVDVVKETKSVKEAKEIVPEKIQKISEKHVTELRPEKVDVVKETKSVKEAKEVIPARIQKTFLIAVRILGEVTSSYDMEYNLRSLGLEYRFNARLLEKNDSTLGMLRLAKDYITWGEVKPQDIVDLLKKRGELMGGGSLTDKVVKERFGQETIGGLVTALMEGKVELRTLWQMDIKPTFRLRPPSDGFNASTKRPFQSQGELGYRGSEISTLLARMR